MRGNVMLEKEIEIFEANKARLKEEYPAGGYVVIKADKILGVWNDRQDALRAGVDKYGDTEFLVKNIEETNQLSIFSRALIFQY